jgi:MFS family permease
MVAGTVGRIGWGVISDRLLAGNRIKTMIIINFTGLIGSAGMIGLHHGVSPLVVYLLAALLGAGFLGFHGVLFACIAEFIDSKNAGAVTGVLVSVSWAGIVVIPVIFGVMADYAGYRWGWLMLAATSLFSMASYGVFLVRRRSMPHSAG